MSYQIRLDNELYEFAESRVENGESTGEAIRRMLEACGVPVPPKKRRSLFAERRREIFRAPILRILAEGNGEAYVADIKEKLFSTISARLTDAERTGKKSARPAWWYDAEYERFEMIREGLVDGTSPRGFWKLTQEGLKRARGKQRVGGR